MDAGDEISKQNEQEEMNQDKEDQPGGKVPSEMTAAPPGQVEMRDGVPTDDLRSDLRSSSTVQKWTRDAAEPPGAGTRSSTIEVGEVEDAEAMTEAVPERGSMGSAHVRNTPEGAMRRPGVPKGPVAAITADAGRSVISIGSNDYSRKSTSSRKVVGWVLHPVTARS